MRKFLKGQSGFSMGGILGSILGVVLLVLVLGKVIPALWPSFVGSDTDIQALSQSDAATVILQSLWPIILLIAGIGMVAAIIFLVLKKFKFGSGGL
jgi:cell division protein FtsX